MENFLEEVRELWKSGESDQALERLNLPEMAENEAALFLRGEIHYARQEWGSALNCFRHCRQINPASASSQAYIELILNILSFFQPDQFNP